MTYSKTKKQKLGSSKRDKLGISKISRSRQRKKIYIRMKDSLPLPWVFIPLYHTVFLGGFKDVRVLIKELFCIENNNSLYKRLF